VDGDASWSSTPGANGLLQIYYRAGAVAGGISCILLIGSTVASSGPTFASTNTGNQPAGSRFYIFFYLQEPSGAYTAAPPTNLQCTITPKAALGAIFLNENNVTTNTP
jgi:hypothetical protein